LNPRGPREYELSKSNLPNKFPFVFFDLFANNRLEIIANPNI